MCTLYLIRHGATANNVANPPRLQGRRDDVPLSAQGRDQAERTARLLAPTPLAAVYASPLRRSRETAERIAAARGLAVAVIDALIEVDVGAWEGRSWSEISETEPEAYRRFMENPAVAGYPDGENLSQVQARVVPAVEQLVARHAGDLIAVIGHNAVNRTLLAAIMNRPVEHAREFSQDNCGVNVIHCRDRVMKLKTMNSVFHLRNE